MKRKNIPRASSLAGSTASGRGRAPNLSSLQWRCPRCGRAFERKSARHSCSVQSVTAFFAGRAQPLRLFRALRELLSALDGVEVEVTRSQVAFKARTRFAWAWLPQKWLQGAPEDALVVSFALRRRLRSRRLKQVVQVGKSRWMHHAVVREEPQLDAELQGWLREAYRLASRASKGAKPSRRDQRFVAQHRGGPLSPRRHRLLATWAADCAEHVLPLFEAHSDDRRPRRALDTARAWSRGEASVGEAQAAAVAAHAAARAVNDRAAVAAARAAGHAVATAHAADHSLGGLWYGLKAVEAGGGSIEAERAWGLGRLPPSVRRLVTSAFEGERFRRRPGGA